MSKLMARQMEWERPLGYKDAGTGLFGLISGHEMFTGDTVRIFCLLKVFACVRIC